MESAVKDKTLVLGASHNPMRYSHMAILRLRQSGIPVVAIGRRNCTVGDVEVYTEVAPREDIHTITLYLNPQNQEAWIPYILSLKPKRIIFNPGTENDVLREQAESAGILCIEACTLVMLASRTYDQMF